MKKTSKVVKEKKEKDYESISISNVKYDTKIPVLDEEDPLTKHLFSSISVIKIDDYLSFS